ncbi:MAG TPA: hypothetical protein ENJ50_02435 [Planctomycetaceae bacterium]|nr:hypothetical protein [Planctomycetaceae bacterium]
MSPTVYDIPTKVTRKSKRGSPALQEFYHHFFVNSTGLIRREVDLSFLHELAPDETAIAKDLIRRNLKLNYAHIIAGAGALRDREAVPQLHSMLARERTLSRRLSIAGALWKIREDPIFLECLRDMVESDDETLKEAHMYQLPWLGNEHAINLLIDLLQDSGSFVRHLALSTLNAIEHRTHFVCLSHELPCGPDDYISRRDDMEFMNVMVQNLRQSYNAHAG